MEIQGQRYGPWNQDFFLDPHQRLWFSQDPCNYFWIQMIIFLTTYFSLAHPTCLWSSHRAPELYFPASALPTEQRSLPFTSHGVKQDNPSVAAVLPDTDWPRWARPKEPDAPMTAAPRGVHPDWLLMETSTLTHSRWLGDSNVPGCPCLRAPGVGQIGGGGGQLWIYTSYMLFCACVCESKWVRQTEGRGGGLP